jgi:hypothetical protein
MAVAQVLHDRVREPRLQDDALGDGSPLAAIHRLMRAGPLHIIDFNHDSTLLAMLGVSPQSEIKRIPIKVERIGPVGLPWCGPTTSFRSTVDSLSGVIYEHGFGSRTVSAASRTQFGWGCVITVFNRCW